MRRRVLLTVLALCAALSTAACTQEAPPLPPRQGAGSVTPTDDPTTKGGAWRDKFSAAELAAYSVGVKRWRDYGARSEKYYRLGRATPGSLRVFEEYFYQPDVMQAALERYQKRQIRFIGQPQLLWTRAKRVDLAAAPPVLVFEECVNLARTSISTKGRVSPSNLRDPVLRTVTMSRVDGGPWLVFDYRGPETGDRKFCDP